MSQKKPIAFLSSKFPIPHRAPCALITRGGGGWRKLKGHLSSPPRIPNPIRLGSEMINNGNFHPPPPPVLFFLAQTFFSLLLPLLFPSPFQCITRPWTRRGKNENWQRTALRFLKWGKDVERERESEHTRVGVRPPPSPFSAISVSFSPPPFSAATKKSSSSSYPKRRSGKGRRGDNERGGNTDQKVLCH